MRTPQRLAPNLAVFNRATFAPSHHPRPPPPAQRPWTSFDRVYPRSPTAPGRQPPPTPAASAARPPRAASNQFAVPRSTASDKVVLSTSAVLRAPPPPTPGCLCLCEHRPQPQPRLPAPRFMASDTDRLSSRCLQRSVATHHGCFYPHDLRAQPQSRLPAPRSRASDTFPFDLRCLQRGRQHLKPAASTCASPCARPHFLTSGGVKNTRDLQRPPANLPSRQPRHAQSSARPHGRTSTPAAASTRAIPCAQPPTPGRLNPRDPLRAATNPHSLHQACWRCPSLLAFRYCCPRARRPATLTSTCAVVGLTSPLLNLWFWVFRFWAFLFRVSGYLSGRD